MASHSSILAWRIPWTMEPGGLQSMGLEESDTTERLNWTELKLSVIIPKTQFVPFFFLPLKVCFNFFDY